MSGDLGIVGKLPSTTMAGLGDGSLQAVVTALVIIAAKLFAPQPPQPARAKEGREMKLVYGISRWTNSSRAAATHIDDGEGKPLCGGNGRKAFSWSQDEGEPTCKRCIRLHDKANKVEA